MLFDKPQAASQQMKSQKLCFIFCPSLREPHERGDRDQAGVAWLQLVVLIQQRTGQLPVLQETWIAYFLWKQNCSKRYQSIQACFKGKGDSEVFSHE